MRNVLYTAHHSSPPRLYNSQGEPPTIKSDSYIGDTQNFTGTYYAETNEIASQRNGLRFEEETEDLTGIITPVLKVLWRKVCLIFASHLKPAGQGTGGRRRKYTHSVRSDGEDA